MTDPAPQETIGPLIGRGNVADVFAFGDAVLKLYHPDQPKRAPFREAANLALLESTTLPVPKVLSVGFFQDRWGLAMTRASGGPPDPAVLAAPGRLTGYFRALAALHRRLTAESGEGFIPQKTRLASAIGRADDLPEPLKSDLLSRLADRPTGNRLCHGDFHPLNILGTGASVTVIDWLDASCGDPAADICRTFVLLHGYAPDLARSWIASCVAEGFGAPDGIAAWLPFVAAARLSENAPGERDRLLAWADGAPPDSFG